MCLQSERDFGHAFDVKMELFWCPKRATMLKNPSRTEKHETVEFAYFPPLLRDFEGGRVPKSLQKCIQKVARFRNAFFIAF